jgi:peptidylprolyl isomerase
MRTTLVLVILAALLVSGCQATEEAEPLDYAGWAATGPVETTESGLQYVIVEEGTGDIPADGSLVRVHYSGYLADDGQMFDSSVERGEPFAFTLGQGEVIQGWDEGVAMMKVGEKRKLIVPAALGYGDTGFPGVIPAGATLVFDVELLPEDEVVE